MASAILVALCAAIVLYRCWRYMFERPPNYPPGPPRLPWLGSYPFLLALNYKQLHRATETLSRWYRTPVLGFHYAGNVPVMTVHEMSVARELLNNPDFEGRPVFELVRARDPDNDVHGIFLTEGAVWKEQRRFTLRHLRDFGFGRRFEELELQIGDQLASFVDLVRNGARYAYERELVPADGIVKLPLAFAGLPSNVFLKCALNECFGREDLADLYGACRSSIRFMRSACLFGRLFSMLPWTKWAAPRASGYRDVRESAMDLYWFAQRIVDAQHRTFDPEHERHFLDIYFKELLHGHDAGGQSTTFDSTYSENGTSNRTKNNFRLDETRTNKSKIQNFATRNASQLWF